MQIYLGRMHRQPFQFGKTQDVKHKGEMVCPGIKVVRSGKLGFT